MTSTEIVRDQDTWQRYGPAFNKRDEGPAYPGLNTVAIKRGRQQAMAAGSVRAMPYNAKRQYGEAVLDAVRKLQRSEIIRVLTPLPAPYRGTNRQIGEAILRRIRGQQQARLLSAPSRVTDKNRQALYEEAMAEKARSRAHLVSDERLAA